MKSENLTGEYFKKIFETINQKMFHLIQCLGGKLKHINDYKTKESWLHIYH